MLNRSGQQLEHYHLLRILGGGNFGQVYLATNMHHRTEVAIKILRLHLEGEELYSFLNEVRTFRLKHAHIISVLDFGVERATATPFIVMDYAPNGTVRQLHPRGSQLPLAKVVQYVKQVAEALQYAHEENLIHRDVKPENMLIGLKQEILLSDFGIAIISQSGHTSLQQPQGTAGTPYYMAPEQIQGTPSRASDQYALGIVTYEWLSGVLPFVGKLLEVYGQHLHRTPPPLPKAVPMLSPKIEQVVMKALEKEPKNRFASVLAFAKALEEAYQEALEFHQTATILKKENVVQLQDYLQETKNLLSSNHLDQALAHCQRLLTHFPDSLESLCLLGRVYLAQNEQNKAQQIFDWVLLKDPENGLAYTNLGYMYEYMKDTDTALAYFQQAYECSKGDRIIRNTINQLESLTSAKQFMLSRSGLARLYMRGRLTTCALFEWEAILAIDPNRLDARVGLLETYWYSNQYDLADKLAQQILEDAPNCLQALLASAHISSVANQQKAKQFIKHIESLDPDFIVARDLLDTLITDQSAFSLLPHKKPSILLTDTNTDAIDKIEHNIEENLPHHRLSMSIISSIKKIREIQISHEEYTIDAANALTNALKYPV